MLERKKKHSIIAKLKALNTESFNQKDDKIQEEIPPFGKFVTKS